MDTTTASTDRRNTHLAAIVDQAPAVALEHGTRAVAIFLTRHGASFALVVRVLTEPARRRRRLDPALRER